MRKKKSKQSRKQRKDKQILDHMTKRLLSSLEKDFENKKWFPPLHWLHVLYPDEMRQKKQAVKLLLISLSHILPLVSIVIEYCGSRKSVIRYREEPVIPHREESETLSLCPSWFDHQWPASYKFGYSDVNITMPKKNVLLCTFSRIPLSRK